MIEVWCKGLTQLFTELELLKRKPTDFKYIANVDKYYVELKKASRGDETAAKDAVTDIKNFVSFCEACRAMTADEQGGDQLEQVRANRQELPVNSTATARTASQ